jgi:DNA replication protein DnaC
MMISTNLGQKELRQRYADRITSRLFGEFSVMVFKGEDIRIKKLDEE